MLIIWCSGCLNSLDNFQFEKELFKTVCECFIEDGYCRLVDEEDKFPYYDEIQFLEERGFVITHQTKEEFLIKPLGLVCRENLWLFCKEAKTNV